MAVGLRTLAAMPATASVELLSLLMMVVGLGGPLVAPPVAAVLLDSAPSHLAGTASGVYNTSRQVGGALAIAVFGAFLSRASTFESGLRASLFLAALVTFATAAASLRLDTPALDHGAASTG